MLEYYLEISNIILQTRHHKYSTLKEVKNLRCLLRSCLPQNYLRGSTATGDQRAQNIPVDDSSFAKNV